MKLSDLAIIAATLLGPIFAVQIQKYLEKWRELKNRKIQVFKILMATRAKTLSHEHVNALNQIDLEFSDNSRKYGRLIDAWKSYHDHLCQKSVEEQGQRAVWNEKCGDLLATMLYEMGKSLGYKFSIVQIKRAAYFPVGHGEIEEDEYRLRKALVEVYTGKRPVPMAVVEFPEMEESEEQKRFREMMMRLLEQGGAIPVKIIENESRVVSPASFDSQHNSDKI